MGLNLKKQGSPKNSCINTYSYSCLNPLSNENPCLNQEIWERSGSVVDCLSRDRGAAGSSLTGVTALYP